jgi:hypothetical protein
MSAMDDGNKMDSTTTKNICQVSGKCSDYQHSGLYFFIATFAFHPSHYTQPYLYLIWPHDSILCWNWKEGPLPPWCWLKYFLAVQPLFPFICCAPFALRIHCHIIKSALSTFGVFIICSTLLQMQWQLWSQVSSLPLITNTLRHYSNLWNFCSMPHYQLVFSMLCKSSLGKLK